MDGKLYIQPERSTAASIKMFLRSTLTRSIHMLFTEPIVGLFSLYVAFNFALQYAFFAAFAYVFESVYGFGLGAQGLSFLGVGVGCLIGFAILVLNNIYIYKPRVARWRAEQARKRERTERKHGLRGERRAVRAVAQRPSRHRWR